MNLMTFPHPVLTNIDRGGKPVLTNPYPFERRDYEFTRFWYHGGGGQLFLGPADMRPLRYMRQKDITRLEANY